MKRDPTERHSPAGQGRTSRRTFLRAAGRSLASVASLSGLAGSARAGTADAAHAATTGIAWGDGVPTFFAALWTAPCAQGVVTADALATLAEHARTAGALLHAPVPAGTRISYFGQPLGIVLASRRDVATAAAQGLAQGLMQMLTTTVSPLPSSPHAATPVLDVASALPSLRQPTQAARFDLVRGDAAAQIDASPVRLKQTYATAPQLPTYRTLPHVTATTYTGLPHIALSHPCEAELRASLAGWSKTPPDWIDFSIESPDGEPALLDVTAKLAWSASSQLRRTVRLEWTAEQAQALGGMRPETIQTVTIGADSDGRLQALSHRSLNSCWQDSDFVEPCGAASRHLYDIANVAIDHQIVRQHIGPAAARPQSGYDLGLFALECAMDELATLLQIDPVALRVRNEAKIDALTGQPWRRRRLLDCYRIGAERMGWSAREHVPSAGQRPSPGGAGRVGYGMAAGLLPIVHGDASTTTAFIAHFAQVQVPADGGDFSVTKYVVAIDAGRQPTGDSVDRQARQQRVQRGVWGALAQALGPATARPRPAPRRGADTASASSDVYDRLTGRSRPQVSPSAATLSPLRDVDITVLFVGPDGTTDDTAARDATGADRPLAHAELEALASCGAAAALANALYNATGIRRRRLPFEY